MIVPWLGPSWCTRCQTGFGRHVRRAGCGSRARTVLCDVCATCAREGVIRWAGRFAPFLRGLLSWCRTYLDGPGCGGLAGPSPHQTSRWLVTPQALVTRRNHPARCPPPAQCCPLLYDLQRICPLVCMCVWTRCAPRPRAWLRALCTPGGSPCLWGGAAVAGGWVRVCVGQSPPASALRDGVTAGFTFAGRGWAESARGLRSLRTCR